MRDPFDDWEPTGEPAKPEPPGIFFSLWKDGQFLGSFGPCADAPLKPSPVTAYESLDHFLFLSDLHWNGYTVNHDS